MPSRRRCCCRRGGCLITVVWLRDAAAHICRVVVGATVTAYDADGGVIDSQTTDINGQVSFSLDTCRTAHQIIAAKPGYTVCGTGLDRFVGWVPGVNAILYLFPETLTISCGGASGPAKVLVDTSRDSFGFDVTWVYSVLMGPGGDECHLGPYGVDPICDDSQSGVSLSFSANIMGGTVPTLRVTEGAPMGVNGVFLGCYAGCHLYDYVLNDCHVDILDAQSWRDCQLFFPYATRTCTATLACPIGNPVASCTIPDYPPPPIALAPAMVSGLMTVAAP